MLILPLPTLALQSAPKPLPYELQWASSAKACRDPDGGGKRFFWYETRCTATQIKPEGANA
jgi:hypothetical protein